jgi:hypothetical protein
MAIAASTSLGNGHTDNSQTTVTFNTNAIIPAGALLVIVSSYWGGATTVAVSGGGLTFVNDTTFSSGNPHVTISRAQVSSDIASGTTITRTLGAAMNGHFISGFYITEHDQASPLTGSVGSASGSTAAFTCGSITPAVANSIVIGANFSDAGAASTTSAPTGGWTEVVDVNEALPAGTAFTALYQIGSGALNPGGTWSNAGAWVGASVAYKPDTSAPAVAGKRAVLPKSLGPRAVGPLFFAPLQIAPPAVVVEAPSAARRRRTMKGAGH